MTRRRRRSPSTPRASSITASAAESPATSSASCRKSRTSLSPKPFALVAQKLGVAMPKVSSLALQEAREAKMRTVAARYSRACLPPSFRSACGAPKAPHAREYLKNRGLDEAHPDFPHRLRARLRLSAPRHAAPGIRRRMLRESGLFSWKDELSALSRSSQENRSSARTR